MTQPKPLELISGVETTTYGYVVQYMCDTGDGATLNAAYFGTDCQAANDFVKEHTR